MEDKIHLTLGGSSAARWANCPGSVFYTKNLPKGIESDAMKKGTIGHKVAEAVLGERLRVAVDPTQDPDYYDRTLAEAYEIADRYGMEIEDSMYDDAEEYAEHIWNNVLEGFVTNKWYSIEQFFVLNEQLEQGGSTDFCAIWTDDRAKIAGAVVDFKRGYTEVDVDSGQLPFYAACLRKYAKENFGVELDYVKTAIFQPHGESGVAWKEGHLTAKQLDRWEQKFFKAAEMIYIKKEQKLKTGSWCTWCPAKAVCTKYVEDRSRETSINLIDPSLLQFPMPETVPVETLVKINTHAADIKKYLNACHEHLKALVLQGNGPSDLKVVESIGRRKWANNPEQIASILVDKGLAQNEVATVKLKGITDISKGLKKLKYKATEVEELIDHCTTRHPTKYVLVGIEDSRPPVQNITELMMAPDEIADEE